MIFIPYIVQINLAPRFIKKLPPSKEVKEGDDITVECKIDEAETGDVVKDVHIKTKGEDATDKLFKESRYVKSHIVSLARCLTLLFS